MFQRDSNYLKGGRWPAEGGGAGRVGRTGLVTVLWEGCVVVIFSLRCSDSVFWSNSREIPVKFWKFGEGGGLGVLGAHVLSYYGVSIILVAPTFICLYVTSAKTEEY